MNAFERTTAYQLIYAGCEPEAGRFTSDLPINSEVWLLYCDRGFERPAGLLLTPHNAVGVAALRAEVARQLPGLQSDGKVAIARATDPDERYLAANESHVLAHIDFFELLRLLPLTSWWSRHIGSALSSLPGDLLGDLVDRLASDALCDWLGERVIEQVASPEALRKFRQVEADAMVAQFAGQGDAARRAAGRLVSIAAQYAALGLLGAPEAPIARLRRQTAAASKRALVTLASCLEQSPAADHTRRDQPKRQPDGTTSRVNALWQVATNRVATHAVYASRKTVKADAAIRVFDTGGIGMRWAIIDSGIDARHPALAALDRLTNAQQIGNGLVSPAVSRVVRTIDFTRLADITSGRVTPELTRKLGARYDAAALAARLVKIERDLANGRMLDWAEVEPMLTIDQSNASRYEAPVDNHGTHVAGILGANWKAATYTSMTPPAPVPTELADADVSGMCPQIELFDLRVFSAERGADEFAILAALQYVRYLNQSKDRQFIHGVNLSVSLRHDVRNYACGSTPVCLECDRLVGSGVIVVAAAGNYGYDDAYGEAHIGGAYRGQSITDPGNSASVITVGATHRTDPYQYGISYFSSHGPTGDGRNKPDLVAPGEKIMSTVPDGGLASMDGTSMAAPHVSGVAALLLARNSELIGQPQRVKDILCASASNLGRDKIFQGAGLLDALRALQAI